MRNAEEDPSTDGLAPDAGSLRNTRIRLGLSLRSVASRADVDPAHLSRIERGEANLTVDVLYRLAVVLEQCDLAQHLHPHLSRRQRQL
ncbi:helix-turn-helix transcriptional regulator [Microtetraspora sp. AC03309]|nr:helix-turn-helix transcriptional regulator [Microtetraspora sp. AC03309]